MKRTSEGMGMRELTIPWDGRLWTRMRLLVRHGGVEGWVDTPHLLAYGTEELVDVMNGA